MSQGTYSVCCFPAWLLDAWSHEEGVPEKSHLFLILSSSTNEEGGTRPCYDCSGTDCLRTDGIERRMVEIPLGVEIGPQLDVAKEKIVLSLSRISPEKGIDDLLKAWQGIDHRGWRLLIAGPSWRGCREELEKMVSDQKISDVEFVGPVFGEDKRRLYARASLFVMPSHTENFGGTVLEALAGRTPVIATTDVAWDVFPKIGCGWWVRRADLQKTLLSAIGVDLLELQKMGEKGRAYSSLHYGWNSIVDRMISEYGKITLTKL